MRLGQLSLIMVLIAASTGASSIAQDGTQSSATFAQHMTQAQTYLRAKRPDLAIPELQAAVVLDPANVEAQGNLGVLLYFQGKPAESVPHLRAALERDPGLSKIQGVLGIAELHTHDVAQGRKDLETALPSIEDTKFKVQVGLELVSLYTESGDLSAALPVLNELRRAAPDNPEVLYATYRTYSDLSDEARLSLSVVAPDSAQMHQLLAHEEIKEGNTSGAVAQYRKAIALDPRLPGVHFELAELLNTSADPTVKQEAEKEYRAALAQNPEDGRSLLRLGDIDVQRDNTQQAVGEYSRAVEIEPADADAKLALAKVLIDLGETDKAQSLLEEAVRLDPTNAVAHYRLGTLYRKRGRKDDANREIEIYKKLKDEKEKMRTVFKDLLIQPKEIHADQVEEK